MIRRLRALLTALGILYPALALGATLTVMPTPFQTVLDSNGNPINGAKVCTYVAGTTTPIATYTDVTGATPNLNPILANSAGRFTAWLIPGTSYKFVYQDASGTANTCDGVTAYTVDNVSAIPGSAAGVDWTGTAGEALTLGQAVYLSDGSGGKTAGLWYKADSGNTYSSTTLIVGIVPSSITSGASGSIRISGGVTGLSSLTIGQPYYVGVAGAITTTPPTNKRLIGQADTTSSLLVTGAEPIVGLTVPLGGTGAATFTAHGVLLGEGTGAIVPTAAGTTGQVLLGVTGADPVFGAQTWTLLKQGSGTSTAAGATTVDSIAITGLTAKDTLVVYYTIESVTADTALTFLRNETDAVQLQTLCAAGGVVTAGSTFFGTAVITPRQGSTTLMVARAEGWGTLAAASIAHGLRATFVTAYTGSWTLGLRHNGVTATGTFSYTWAVYKVAGQ